MYYGASGYGKYGLHSKTLNQAPDTKILLIIQLIIMLSVMILIITIIIVIVITVLIAPQQDSEPVVGSAQIHI